MWGWASAAVRFIPTPVGNTGWCPIIYGGEPVHPHACGEHSSRRTMVRRWVGSSPRLWGTPAPPKLWQIIVRFIPTPVGNTPWPASPSLPSPVHPHACGEHSGQLPGASAVNGSSPRLWGTRGEGGSGHFLQRFIPTPVGNTLEPNSGLFRMPVHPHACGEH